MPFESSWNGIWARMTDEDLEAAARDYLWLAAVHPDLRAGRRDEVLQRSFAEEGPRLLDERGPHRRQPGKSIRAGQASADPT
jgi:hypothetical protein